MTKEEVVAKIEWGQEKLKDDIAAFYKELKEKTTINIHNRESFADDASYTVDTLLLQKWIDECSIAYSMLDWVKEMLEE